MGKRGKGTVSFEMGRPSKSKEKVKSKQRNKATHVPGTVLSDGFKISGVADHNGTSSFKSVEGRHGGDGFWGGCWEVQRAFARVGRFASFSNSAANSVITRVRSVPSASSSLSSSCTTCSTTTRLELTNVYTDAGSVVSRVVQSPCLGTLPLLYVSCALPSVEIKNLTPSSPCCLAALQQRTPTSTLEV